MRPKAVKLWILAVAFLVLTHAASALAQGRLYTDPINEFRVVVPDEWGDAPVDGRMVWNIASENGTVEPACNVRVATDWSYAGLTPEKFVESQSEDQFKKILSTHIDDLRVGVWDANYRFGGQVAIQYVYTGTLDGIRKASLGLQTVYSGRLYTFTCIAPANEFPNIYLDLLAIAESFSFTSSTAAGQASSNAQSSPTMADEGGSALTMSDAWKWGALLLGFTGFVISPIVFTYWKTVQKGYANTFLWLSSFVAVFIVGSMIAALLFALQRLSHAWFMAVPFALSFAHYWALRHYESKHARSSAGGR